MVQGRIKVVDADGVNLFLAISMTNPVDIMMTYYRERTPRRWRRMASRRQSPALDRGSLPLSGLYPDEPPG